MVNPLGQLNALRGTGATNGAFLVSSEGEESKSSYCQQINSFILKEDGDEWDRLCREMPHNTTIAERFALLAENNCERRGNPRSVASVHERMNMTSNLRPEALECFHRPDRQA
jgi:hypothetical protein